MARKERIGLRPSEGPGLLLQVTRGRWLYDARVVERGGELIVDSLTVQPTGKPPPAGGVNADVLRRFPTRKVLDEARLWQRWAEEQGRSFFSDEARARLHETKGRGRRKDPDFYAMVASDYLVALREAPRRPIAWLAEEYAAGGVKGVTTARVRDWVHRCRKHGLLSEGRRAQGVPGAEPTDKLREWMRARGREAGARTREHPHGRGKR